MSNRKYRRAIERAEKKDKIHLTKSELERWKKKTADEYAKADIEVLMTIMAVALHRKHGWGLKRISDILAVIDEINGDLISGKVRIFDLMKELREEVGLEIKF